MNKPLVSFESVSVAAEELKAKGVTPSIPSVRAHLGGGSPNDIAKHLRQWKEGNPVIALSEIVLGTEIQNAIKVKIQEYAKQAQEASENEKADLENQLNLLTEENAAMGQQLSDQANLIEKLESEKSEAVEKVQRANGLLAELREQLNLAHHRNTELNRELAGYMAKAALIDDLKETIKKLEKKNTYLENRNEKLREVELVASELRGKLSHYEK